MDFNKIKEMGLEYAEKGKNAALDLAEKGRTQAKIVNAQSKLYKAQRQLGALVYSLAKGNEENQPLVDKYIEMIDNIEQEIARLGTDSRLRITVAALGDRAFPAGKIEKGAVANPATHTYDVRATLSNADGELLPGMVCRVVASPAGAAEEIALPIRAVQQAGDGSRFVWKVSGDSVVRTAVATGRLVNNAVTITAGIQAGDRIVTDGMQKIGQGSKVIAE